MPTDSDLAGLVERFLTKRGWKIADLARATGLSYKECHRIATRKVFRITDDTIDLLVAVGVASRQAIVLAAYNSSTSTQSANGADSVGKTVPRLHEKGKRRRPANGTRRPRKATAST